MVRKVGCVFGVGLLFALWACGTGTPSLKRADAGVTPGDAGVTPSDAGPGESDAGGDAGPAAGAPVSLLYVNADHRTLGIRSSGYQTSAVLTFQVVDDHQVGVPGVSIQFAATPSLAALANSGVTDSSGFAVTTVSAVDQVGLLTVTATAPPFDGGLNLSASSPPLFIVGAKTATLYATCNPRNLAANATPFPPRPNLSSTCALGLSDRFNNPIGFATSVSWFAEAGSVISPVTSVPAALPDGGGWSTGSGVATTTFSTTGPWPPRDTAPLVDAGEPSAATADLLWSATGKNPRDMLVTVIAVTPGEETFFDGSGTSNGIKNGKWDPGEWFIDVSEPYIDENDNQQWDPGEPFIDTPQMDCATGIISPPNGVWDPPNGCWDANILLWAPTHILYSGPLTQMNLSPLGPYVVPPAPGDELLQFQLLDDFSNRLAPDALALTASLLGPRGSVAITPDPSLALPYGFTINYSAVQVTETSRGVFSVDGPCNPSAPFTASTSLPIKTRCVQQYSFSNFGLNEGDFGSLDLVGASPSLDGGPTPAVIQLTGADNFSSSTFSFPVTYQ